MKLPDNFPGRGRMLVQAFGLALLSACLGEFTAPQLASITVTVIPALGVGETAQASATLKDVYSKLYTVQGDTVQWSSSDTRVATISSAGVVTGRAAGIASITAFLLEKSGSANISISSIPASPAPVATITITLTPTSVVVGQTSLVGVVLTDANGTQLSGRTTTYGTSDATVASVSTTGIASGLKVGTATITATSEGKSATAVLTVTPPASGDGIAPTYNAASQVLLFQDNFDRYATYDDAVAAGWRAANGQAQQDFTTNPAGANQIQPGGLTANGHFMRLVYDGIQNSAGPNQEGHSWSRSTGGPAGGVGDVLAGQPGHTFYISFYFRINPGGGFALDDLRTGRHLVHVKWLMLWNSTDGNRAQFNTTYGHCGRVDVPFLGGDGSGTLFEFYGNSAGGTTCQATQVKPPYAYQGAGQWHLATYKYVTQSVQGARDGIAQMWYDGTLIVSVAPGYCGVAVPDGVNTGTIRPPHWCEAEDQDQMYVKEYVRRVTLGSVMTAALWPFSIDYDNMTVWRDP